MGNKNIIQKLYAAFESGDVPAALAGMSERIEWNEAEHFLYSDRNHYTSPASVAEGAFWEMIRGLGGLQGKRINYTRGRR